jgi:hypothetical protein
MPQPVRGELFSMSWAASISGFLALLALIVVGYLPLSPGMRVADATLALALLLALFLLLMGSIRRRMGWLNASVGMACVAVLVAVVLILHVNPFA